jgi:O-antigen/teichoic acid export membrane protein
MFKKNLTNLISLAFVQGANALFPILMFPYLYSVLGETDFSLLVVSEAVIFYILAICLYSFDVTGVKELIIDIDKQSKVFWQIIITGLFPLVINALDFVWYLTLMPIVAVIVAVIVVLISCITYVYIEKVFMNMSSRVVISKHKLYMSS